MASPTGIRKRHSTTCPAREGGACRCDQGWEAFVYSPRDGQKIRKTFATLGEAKRWRADAQSQVSRGALRAAARTTVREAWEAWYAGATSGTIRKPDGERFKPSALRSYEASMRLRVLDDFGAARLAAVRRLDLQDFVDRMLAEGLDPSTIRNTLMPLRVVYRRAVSRGELVVSPTSGLELPAVRGQRERIASPAEAAELIAALPEADRALWAVAFYAGLRRGELRALRWEEVDLTAGVLRVERGFDEREGVIETKSKAGRRDVPIVGALRSYLAAHRLRSGRSTGYAFTGRAAGPFTPSAVRRRAATAWKKANAERSRRELDALEPIGLHEARHTFASLLIAAGVNVKAISAYMGHSSISITLDRYGHLMPGHAAEAVDRIDAYLDSATGAQTGAQTLEVAR